MELSTAAIHDVVHPTAAFNQAPAAAGRHDQSNENETSIGAQPSWETSHLNPKNRIDSLELPRDPLWRIDGCAGIGTQYFAIPLFINQVPPLRIDVFIAEEVTSSLALRRLLGLDSTFHVKDGSRVRRLGIAKHIVRALQVWTLGRGVRATARDYMALPFGSRIIFNNLALDVHKISITVSPAYDLEQCLVALPQLARTLKVSPYLIPKELDINQLELVEQIQESVSLVRLRSPVEEGSHVADNRVWVLKALTSGIKYLFHELRNLVQMEPHPNVISKPAYIVTKDCRFGGKRGVVGFMLPYHTGGSLRDHLPLLRTIGLLNPEDQIRWATQLTEAAIHVRERGKLFYPDLRLDNVVLTDQNDAIMIDFEQRGVWCEFASPEVNAIEYVRILAADGDDDDDDDHDMDVDDPPFQAFRPVPLEVRNRYALWLDHMLAGWRSLESAREYSLPNRSGYFSYNIPWLCLDAREQEAAEVYMLGRVLWCIFEGQSAPQRKAVWQSYKREADIEFPEYRRTPYELRDLIDRCTRGRREPLSNVIARVGNKLVLRRPASADTGPSGAQRDEILRQAQAWWTAELKTAEEFIRVRLEATSQGKWDSNYFQRPSMREVLRALEAYKAKLDSG